MKHQTCSLLLFALVSGAAPAVRAQSDSSTTAVPLPDEGGPMRRAPMPEGGVDDGMPRERTPQGGTPDDGMKRAPMPDCHAHEGQPAGEEHCHAHEGNHAHSHGTKPTATPPAPAAEDGGEQRGRASAFAVDESQLGRGVGAEVMGVKLTFNGYVRVLAEVIENDTRSAFIGRNDGFKLGNARFGLNAERNGLSAFVSLEAAVGDRDTFNDPNATFTVRPRDAFLRYELSRYARITAGRFKAPYDLGELEITALRTFIDQPVESRGVLPTQGIEVLGLSQNRQLGVIVHKEKLGLTDGGFDLGYALALTNGRTFDLSLNDNDRPAAFARISAMYGDWVQLNVGGFTDSRTVGELPNLFDEEAKGLEVSLLTSFLGMHIQGQILLQNTLFETSGRPDVNSIGGHVQWTYERWDAWLGYRFAYYNPNTQDIDDADAVIEHTVGLGYEVTALALRFMLNGTVAQEQEGRKVDNNRLTLLAQYIF